MERYDRFERSAEAGRDRSHILSWEVLNALFFKDGHTVPEDDSRRHELFVQFMGSNGNIRMKTPAGNRDPSYWQSDRASDLWIIQTYKEEKGVNHHDSQHIQRQWAAVANSPFLTDRDKEGLRQAFNSFRDSQGHVIVRANAPYTLHL